MKKIFLTICILVLLGSIVLYFVYENNKDNPRFKLALLMINNSFSQIQEKYAKMDCKNFNSIEKSNGFEGLVTAYCKPKANDFKSREDFLCSVGLNCSCPNGRNDVKNCKSSTLSWSSCNDFDDKKIDYCDQTADQSSPTKGQVAADWSCFPKGSTIYIGENKYKVADKGSAIKGRRFDVWFDNCKDIEKKTGIYQIKLLN